MEKTGKVNQLSLRDIPKAHFELALQIARDCPHLQALKLSSYEILDDLVLKILAEKKEITSLDSESDIL